MGALRIETAPDGVATVLYDVPGAQVNTLRDSFEREFDEAFGKLAEDASVKAIVLASGKPDSFVVGADVEMLARLKMAAEATALARGGQQAMQRLEDLGKRKPVVAAIPVAVWQVGAAADGAHARDPGRASGDGEPGRGVAGTRPVGGGRRAED